MLTAVSAICTGILPCPAITASFVMRLPAHPHLSVLLAALQTPFLPALSMKPIIRLTCGFLP